MSGLILRDATAADVPTLLRLVRALADYERLLHEVTATEAELATLLFGEPRRAEALLAERDGNPVGFALWYFSVSTFWCRPKLYVEDVFVVPESRGTGIGRMIFADLARRAVAAGCPRMEWSVLDWNVPSIAFYRSLGAVPREGWTLERLDGDALLSLAATASPGSRDDPKRSLAALDRRLSRVEGRLGIGGGDDFRPGVAWPTAADIFGPPLRQAAAPGVQRVSPIEGDE